MGCHFGRSEAPFCYDTSKNKYVKFQKGEVFVDMYRSNDVIRFEQSCIYVRPFVKVGEPSESVKVYKYFLEKTKQDLNKVIKFEENGPEKSVDRQANGGHQVQGKKVSKLIKGTSGKSNSISRPSNISKKGDSTPSTSVTKVDPKKIEYAYSGRKSDNLECYVASRFERL